MSPHDRAALAVERAEYQAGRAGLLCTLAAEKTDKAIIDARSFVNRSCGQILRHARERINNHPEMQCAAIRRAIAESARG